MITINKIAFEKVIRGTSFYFLREIVNAGIIGVPLVTDLFDVSGAEAGLGAYRKGKEDQTLPTE